MIGYDLNSPGQDYASLIEAIEGLSGTRWHCLDSTWLIKTDLTSVQIRDRLLPHIDKSDELLVARLAGEAAWYGFNQECADWLVNNL